jgi:hypothetical protein
MINIVLSFIVVLIWSYCGDLNHYQFLELVCLFAIFLNTQK